MTVSRSRCPSLFVRPFSNNCAGQFLGPLVTERLCRVHILTLAELIRSYPHQHRAEVTARPQVFRYMKGAFCPTEGCLNTARISDCLILCVFGPKDAEYMSGTLVPCNGSDARTALLGWLIDALDSREQERKQAHPVAS